MSRNLKLAIAIGLLLIAFGMLLPEPEMRGSNATPPARSSDEIPAGMRPGDGDDRVEDALGPRSRLAAETIEGTTAVPKRVPLELTFVLKESREPAQGAHVGLWRSATGEGAAYRPAKRLRPDQAADDEGRARFDAPTGVEIEIVGRTADGGELARRRLGVLRSAPKDRIVIALDPPPAPLEIIVRDDQAAPVPGASIRLAETERQPAVEFPANTKLVLRTDGRGRGTLGGEVRAAGWIVIDAAGFGPYAVPQKDFDGLASLAVTLEPDAELELTVRGPDGEPLKEALVEVEFRLSGFRAKSVAKTNKRGSATLSDVPARTKLFPTVIPEGELARRFDPFEVEPGETKSVALDVQ